MTQSNFLPNGAIPFIVGRCDKCGAADILAPKQEQWQCLICINAAADAWKHEHNLSGPCPICGVHTNLLACTTDGRLIAKCGDAFTVAQWRKP